jgi:hypothetical protein
MGTRLPSLLRLAGLEPQPPHEVTGAVYTGVAVVQHLTNMMLDIDTFAERVSIDLGPDPLLVQGPDLAVWAKKP